MLGVYPRPLLAALLPALLAAELAFFLVAARGGWLGAKVRATLSIFRGLPSALRRRGAVQAAATVAPSEFATALTAGLDSPFLGPSPRSGLWPRRRPRTGGS